MTGTDNERLRELNIELLETVALAARTVLDYTEKNHIPFRERFVLGHLLKRAASILDEIGMSMFPQLCRLSDAFIHPKSSDEDYNSTPFRLVQARNEEFGHRIHRLNEHPL